MSNAIMQAIEHGHLLIESVDRLRSALEEARDQIRVEAAFGIDMRLTTEVDSSEPIEVSQLEGEAAVDAIIKGLTAIRLEPEQNPKVTLRVPGAVGLPAELLEMVLASNALRNEMYLHMSLIEGGRNRRAVWEKFGALSGLQALRQTIVLERPALVSFFWAVGSSLKRYQVADLRKELLSQLPDPTDDQVPYDVTHLPRSVEKRLKTQLNLMASLPDTEQVAIRRPIRPHVRSRVERLNEDGTVTNASMLAPVPFVYDINHPAPAIKPLATYQESDRGSEYSHAKFEAVPFIQEMHLYRYKPKYRQFGALKSENVKSRIWRLKERKNRN